MTVSLGQVFHFSNATRIEMPMSRLLLQVYHEPIGQQASAPLPILAIAKATAQKQIFVCYWRFGQWEWAGGREKGIGGGDPISNNNQLPTAHRSGYEMPNAEIRSLLPFLQSPHPMLWIWHFPDGEVQLHSLRVRIGCYWSICVHEISREYIQIWFFPKHNFR